MSIFNTSGDKGVYSALIANVGSFRDESGKASINQNSAKAVVSFESLDSTGKQAAHRDMSGMVQSLRNIYNTVREKMSADAKINGITVSTESFEKLSDEQLRAGATVLLGLGDVGAYAKKAFTSKGFSVSTETMREPLAFGPGGELDISMPHPSLEAYDKTELAKHAEKSVVFNMFAARQDSVCELLFKTTVQTPDEIGVAISVDNVFVINDLRHSLTGAPADIKRRNLLRAFSDHTILQPEFNRIVPVYVSSGPNNNTAFFSTDTTPWVDTVAGESVTTNALRFGTEFDLLGLGTTDSLAATGTLDITDTLDGRIAVDSLFLKFVNGATTKIARVFVSRRPRTQFYKSPEGGEREMSLSYRGQYLVITEDLRAVDNSVIPGIADLATGHHKVKFAVELTGTADAITGNGRVDLTKAAVTGVLNGSNVAIPFTSGAGQTLVTGLGTISVVGFTLEARRTNSNRRQRGLLLDTYKVTEQYKVFHGSPISHIRPTNQDGSADANITHALVAATYARNTNQGITTLINEADLLQAMSPMFGNPDEPAPVGGLGRLVTKAYYKNIEADVEANVNSISTHERHEDIREYLGGLLRYQISQMYYQSSYQPALDMISGGTAGKPHVAIVTDPVIQKYLYVQGDPRFLGDAFDFTVVSNLDKRLEGKIFLTFVRPQESGIDILGFGNFIWVPELITTLQMYRNGALSTEIGVQPRTLHVVNLPILVEIDVKNLEEAIGEKTAAPAIA